MAIVRQNFRLGLVRSLDLPCQSTDGDVYAPVIIGSKDSAWLLEQDLVRKSFTTTLKSQIPSKQNTFRYSNCAASAETDRLDVIQ